MTEKTREEALAHFGVAGMRWGVRKNPITAQARQIEKPAKPKKPTTSDIHEARAQVNARLQDVYDADRKVRRATNPGEKEAALKDVETAFKAFVNDPSHKTANKHTRGEKVAAALLITSGALTLTSILAGAAAN